ERVLRPGVTRVSGPGAVHAITNMGTEPAVSVHVYAPRLTAMTPHEDVRTAAEAVPVAG
ncbi:MAG: cysteine dioxygenase, partial [Streptomycetaceae bacterium]|nr:cysteine dioxygenase [Streptomycetaceae bacterium]